MTTDHDLIARACSIVELVPCIWHDDGRVAAYCEASVWEETLKREDGKAILIPGETYPINDALHTLLVWRLAKALAARPYAWSEGDTEPTCIVLSTGGHGWCIWREMCDGSQEIGPDNENPGELKEPIDIIRVLVDALEEAG